jgi:hypothetical protein
MLNSKELEDIYDSFARQYIDRLKFHAATQKAVYLDSIINLMENLDKQLAALGEE